MPGGNKQDVDGRVKASGSDAVLQTAMSGHDDKGDAWLAEHGMKVIGLSGWSGAGKTTLLARVIPYLLGQGLRVSVVKHAHHEFDVDVPGKDSWTHRQSGATEVLVSSSRRWALMHELRGASEPRLAELLTKMSPVDLVVVEGFKRDPHRKIEVHRLANSKPLLFPDDPGIVGIVTDAAVETRLPVARLDDVEAAANLLRRSAIPVEDVLAKRATGI
jgi:molybdopterin-guanine dinucleotide biosynthesis adapter protein